MPSQAERRQRRKDREAEARQRADQALRAAGQRASDTRAVQDLCRSARKAGAAFLTEPAPEPPSRAMLERILGQSAASGRRWDPNARIELAAPGILTVHEGAGTTPGLQDLSSDFVFQADTTVTVYHDERAVVTYVQAGQSWGSVCARSLSRPGCQARALATAAAEDVVLCEPEAEDLCDDISASVADSMRAHDIATVMDTKATHYHELGQQRPARLLRKIARELRRLARAEGGDDLLPVEFAIEVAMRNLELV